MPTYEYFCKECRTVADVVHSIKETPVVECEICLRAGKHYPMERMISHNIGGFIIKGWTEAMAWRTKREKSKGYANMGVKQIDRYGVGPKLQPNVAGMEVDSWSDAQKVAKEAGMDTTSYEPHIEKEQAGSKIIDTAWKTAKAEAGKV